MARKPRYTQSENTRRTKRIPVIRYARKPMFLRGMRDKKIGRGVSVKQSMTDEWEYYDGRQFAAMFPAITTREIKSGREADVPWHVMAAINKWFEQAYVPPGHGGRAYEQWLKLTETQEH